MESVHYCIHEEEEEEDDDDDDDENAYIEINLGPQSRAEKEGKKEKDEGVEFRVSYLEGGGMPFISISSPPSSAAATHGSRPPEKRGGDLLSRRGNSRANSSHHCRNSAPPETHSKQLLLSSSRKGGSSSSGRAEEDERGGTERRIMNVMFKFRCFVMSFPWKAAWRIRSHQPPKSAAATASSSPSTSARFTPPAAVKSPPRHPTTSSFQQAAAEKPRSSVFLLGMKLRELVASSPSDHGRGGGGKPSKSCPASVKSTPLHRHQWAATSFAGTVVYTRDNSVQAAIAHCNKSSGRSELDFSF